MTRIDPADGRLKDPRWLASRAALGGPGGPFPHTRVPGVTWVVEYPGQMTGGRVGAPVVQSIPLSWLPMALQQEVNAILNEAAQRKETT